MIDWYDIEPKDATDIVLPRDDIRGPLNELGEPCPWPWEPQQLVGVALGQYHCGYCGGMVVAGLPHLDYDEDWWGDEEYIQDDTVVENIQQGEYEERSNE